METLLIHRDLLRTPIFDQIIDMLRTEHVRNVHQHSICLFIALQIVVKLVLRFGLSSRNGGVKKTLFFLIFHYSVDLSLCPVLTHR